VAPVAHRGLRHLGVEGEGAAQQRRAQRGVRVHRVAERRRADPQRAARHLHLGRHRRAAVAEDERQPDQALPADQPDLDPAPVLQRAEHGHHARLDEVHRIDPPARRVEARVQGQADRLQGGSERRQHAGRQGG
jgi:hypothetical protein